MASIVTPYTALHALIGYTARPDGIQLLFYVATLAIVSGIKTTCTTAADCTARGITLVAAPSIVWWNDVQPPRTTSP